MRGGASGIAAAGSALEPPAVSQEIEAAPARRAPGAAWIFVYIAIQFACQLALLSQALAPARVFFRSAAFCASLLFLLLVPRGIGARSAARSFALVTMAILTLSAVNPAGGAPLAVVAHWALYLAILAPIFWVSRLELKGNILEKVMLVFWAFHLLSSIFALLQVYFPGQFQPAVTTFITEKHVATIRLASGEYVPRPMGLSDTPGAAAGSGLYAALLGVGVVFTRPFRFAAPLGLAGMVIGMTCIYLSQVRAVLVMLGICFLVLTALLAFSGRLPRLVWVLVIGSVVGLAGFELAFELGGTTVTNRLASLVEHDPTTVYRVNRGRMLEHAFETLLPEYPLGAGLGHWGMMNAYFGSREHEIGAELQFVGWLLDGGVPLILVYLAAILSAIFFAVRTTLRATEARMEGWAAVVGAYDVGTLALCFSYVPFMSSPGLEFWLINAVLAQIGGARMLEASKARAT